MSMKNINTRCLRKYHRFINLDQVNMLSGTCKKALTESEKECDGLEIGDD